jgi:hypothetical protein
MTAARTKEKKRDIFTILVQASGRFSVSAGSLIPINFDTRLCRHQTLKLGKVINSIIKGERVTLNFTDTACCAVTMAA